MQESKNWEKGSLVSVVTREAI